MAHGLENPESGSLDKWGRADVRRGERRENGLQFGSTAAWLGPTLYFRRKRRPVAKAARPLARGERFGHEAAFLGRLGRGPYSLRNTGRVTNSRWSDLGPGGDPNARRCLRTP